MRSRLGERNHNLAHAGGKNFDFVVDPNRRHFGFLRGGLTSNPKQAEKISILWLIQIDAILDFSDRVWVWVVSLNTACKLPMKLHNSLLVDFLFVFKTVFTQD